MLKLPSPPPAFGEGLLQSALANHFSWDRNQCFPGVCMWTWEQDFVVITPAGRVWEIEIKTSAQDWQNDSKKDKWESKHWSKVARLYYCVPAQLIAKMPEIPDYAGVLVATVKGNRIGLHEHRPAKNRSTFSISPAWLHKLYRSTYFRFWRSRRHDPTAGIFLPAQEQEQKLLQNA
jgi:hypothetical protein